ncbi:Na(+)-translocating NADH-quinone reductase subunit F [bioreactor metagenome]|uniref:Na(+)-translocating NADH-quinone reductase subunit F n=1 Tax=bioreactor metagenome TaxID=1076179 RepID=A0A645GIR4_9ZZZZ
MQENRSFDHYFGTMRGVRGFGDRFPIPLSNGNTVYHQPDPKGGPDIPPFRRDSTIANALIGSGTPHNFPDQQAAWNQGKMDRWIQFKNQATMGFFLREDSARPILLIAGGTGFAPVKAIVEHALAEESQRPMTIYWGGRRREDLYLNTLGEGWMRTHAHIRYTPVLSESAQDDEWTGRTGLVHLAAMQDIPDLSAHQVYVCGAPAMVAAARRDFVGQCGLPEHEFFADAFEYAGDAKAPRVLSNRTD